jgi:hypothetical protein
MYKADIGVNAGVIWRLLSEKGELSIREIGEYAQRECCTSSWKRLLTSGISKDKNPA